MYTVTKLKSIIKGKELTEASCLSTDTKPTENVANGSLVLEMDTNKIYAYDAEGEAWVELA